jgi:tetraacyldisaccharide 4'-kinase
MRPPEFWSRNEPAARLIATALSPLGYFYGATVAWKHRRQRPWRSSASVVCVGNLTVGGSGKTPVAIALAGMFQAKGATVAFLSRGYGRRSSDAILVDAQDDSAADVGDEALLLSRIAPTIVSRNRAEGARLAEQHGADVIVMDDGHQNFTLAKDVALVVVDGENAFGNGGIVPVGPLREPVHQGLARADAVILMGDGAPPLSGFARPVFRARLMSDRLFDGQKLIAFAGIGRPDKFFASLRALGAKLVEMHAFADHHAYTAAELAMLRDRAKNTGAGLITTEKDLVRLSVSDRIGIDVLPVHAMFEDPAALERFLIPLSKASILNP